MSSSINNAKKPLTTTSKATIEMDHLPKTTQNRKSEYRPPLFPSLEQPIELTINPEQTSETVHLNQDDPEDELQKINIYITQNYKWYLFVLILVEILYIVVISLYWTDFVGAPELFFEETSYFALLLFMAPLWVVGIAIFFSRVHRLQTIFIVLVLTCMVIGIILIILDIFIKHPSSQLDTATNPKIMVVIFLIGPGYVFTKASKFRSDLHKRKKIIERIEKLKELNAIAKGSEATNSSLSMRHREMLVL